jgi:streptogramin lyase
MRPSLLNALRFFAFIGATALLTACGGGNAGTIPAAAPNGISPLSTGIMGSASSLVATPAPAPVINEYPTLTAGSGPVVITTGPDGALWFTEGNVDKIGRMTTAGVNTNEFSDGSPGSFPNGIALGPDNRLWFTEYSTNQIGAMTTTGTVQQYSGLTGSNPAFIVKGSDNAMWFTEFSNGGAGKIGRITTSGVLHESGDGSGPWEITSGPDGALWFAESNSSSIGRMAITGTLIAQYPTGQPFPYNIAVGPDGAVWFTECATFGNPSSTKVDSIGRVTLAGTVTEYPVKTQGSCPNGITAGPDGNMWFVENGYLLGPPGASAVGKITMTGAVTEYPLANPTAGPMYITKGPDGNLWFTENSASKIGEVVFPSASGSGSGSDCSGKNDNNNHNNDNKNGKNDKCSGDKDAKHGDNNQDGKNGDGNNNQQCCNH